LRCIFSCAAKSSCNWALLTDRTQGPRTFYDESELRLLSQERLRYSGCAQLKLNPFLIE
jgi:hypothetical protein